MNRTIEDLDINDYVEYLSEVCHITIFPNNDLEEAALNLEDCGVTVKDALVCARHYCLNDDVLWVNTETFDFGTWPMWGMENLYGEKVLAWINEQES